MWDQKKAEAEVETLNALETDGGRIYFWQYTRVEDYPDDMESDSSEYHDGR